MIGEIANILYEDEEWLTKAGITEDQIDEHWQNTDFKTQLQAGTCEMTTGKLSTTGDLIPKSIPNFWGSNNDVFELSSETEF